MFIADLTKIYPTFQIAREGESVQFLCSAEGPVSWSFNKKFLPENVIVSDHNLTIPEVSYYNEGSYECHGFNYEGENLETQGLLKVRSKFAAKFYMFTVILHWMPY